MNSALAGVLLVFGVIQCFAGYRLLRFIVVGTGFGVGASAGVAATQLLSGGQSAQAIAGVVFGLVFAWLATRIYFAGVFMLGAAAGAAISVWGAQMLGKELLIPSIILFAIVSGITAVALQRWAVIFSTVILGAAMCAIACQVLITGNLSWQHLGSVEVGLAVVLMLTGGFRQMKN
jgi:hypothetical protein